MAIEILENSEFDSDWVFIQGSLRQFHVYGEAEDYVEETAQRMQQAANHCFQFPFYVHFEGRDDEDIDWVMKHDQQFEIIYQDSGRTLSGYPKDPRRIPVFSVTIEHKRALEEAYQLWFHLAFENCMWLVMQDQALDYGRTYASITLRPSTVVLLPNHDAQSLSFITNDPTYDSVQAIQRIFQ